jgi:hypothetical protein
MKKMLIGVLIAGVIFFMAGVSSAAIKAGDNTLTVSGQYSWPSHGDSVWQVAGNYGRFFTDSFQLESGIGLAGTSGFNEQIIQVRPNFHFNTQSNAVPYIGATLGWQHVGDGVSDSTFIYGAQVGIKTFIKENAFLQFELNYIKTSTSILGQTGSTNLTLGMGFKF